MDKYAESKRKYYLANRERLLAIANARRAENPEMARQTDREKYQRVKENRKSAERERRKSYPQKMAAKGAVLNARRQKRLPSPKTLICALCGRSASDYHHPSYRESDFLNVVPLCRSCHIQEHDRAEPSSNLGIVVLNIGIVRIAIASND